MFYDKMFFHSHQDTKAQRKSNKYILSAVAAKAAMAKSACVFVPLWQIFIDFYLLFVWQRECGTKMDASPGRHPCAYRF
jgi:hypothetical protein